MAAERMIWRHRAAAALALPLLIAFGAYTETAAQQGGGVAPSLPPTAQPSPLTPAEPLPDAGSGTSSSQSDGDSLSDKLSRSGGVIQPPANADPGIHQPTPNPGAQRMPVIPPPGTPGNAPEVKPK
jgi:hypothetical protein